MGPLLSGSYKIELQPVKCVLPSVEQALLAETRIEALSERPFAKKLTTYCTATKAKLKTTNMSDTVSVRSE